MSILADLTFRGALVAVAVMALDRLFRQTTGSTRRAWWCLVPIAFLVPLRIPILPHSAPVTQVLNAIPRAWANPASTDRGFRSTPVGLPWLGALWIAGALGYAAYTIVLTVRTSRRWASERLSTDHRILEVLESCKAELGVTAPLGVVISSAVAAPAIHGWLRPRILLPAPFAEVSPDADLRAVFLHELAHFRALDIPFDWLLTLVCALHWFNPLAHIARRSWARFREEAADETAVLCMQGGESSDYAACLVRILRQAKAAAGPFGSLSIVETKQHLKTRLLMIPRYSRTSRRLALATVFILAAASFIVGKTALAESVSPDDAKAASISGAQAWLAEIDTGKYADSWQDASSFFKSKVSRDQWVSMNRSTREPLGKSLSRKQASAMYQKDPSGPGGTLNGEVVTIQYASSFENMKQAVETVVFMKDTDGQWRAVGYLIKP